MCTRQRKLRSEVLREPFIDLVGLVQHWAGSSGPERVESDEDLEQLVEELNE